MPHRNKRSGGHAGAVVGAAAQSQREKSAGEPPASRLPAGKSVLLLMALVLEPELPAREKMDNEKMGELIESMNTLGLLQPIITVQRNEHYEIVDGHRRFLAARALEWQHIPALVFQDADIAVEAAKVHANLMREDLNAAEEAVFYAQCLEKYHLDEAGLCHLVKRNPNYIADRLRLLRDGGPVFEAVRAGAISFSTGRELNKVSDESMRTYFLDSAIRSGANFRVVATWVAEWKARAVPPPAPVESEAATIPQPEVEPYVRRCLLCGGDKDPYNLVDVAIHKWEWDFLRQLAEKAGKGE